VRLARAHQWRRAAPRDDRREVTAYTRTGSAFEPIDMGIDPVKWPSERGEGFKSVELPPWPSLTWDDPHFGRKRAPVRAAPSKATTPPEPVTTGSDATGSSAPPQSASLPTRLAAPNSREVEQLIDQLGLAGAVKEIMQRTGWDFKKSAQYLAKARAR
jgi:hypothetical protein